MLVVTFPVMLSMVPSVMLSMVVSRIRMRGGMIALHIGHVVPFVDEL